MHCQICGAPHADEHGICPECRSLGWVRLDPDPLKLQECPVITTYHREMK